VLVGLLARRAGELPLVALAQLDPGLARAGDRARPARPPLAQLGDERHLGVERAGELGDEAAQERAADDAGGPGGEPAEQIALAVRPEDLCGGGGHKSLAMLTRATMPAQ
jgi:hypothetical protein